MADVYYAGTATAQREPEIEQGLNELERRTSELMGVISSVADRFSPALSPSPPSPEKPTRVPQGSAVGAALSGANDRIEQATRALGELIDRCELPSPSGVVTPLNQRRG